MNSPLVKLSGSAIAALADALCSGRIAPPYSSIGVRQYVAEAECAAVAGELQRLANTGMAGAHIAYVLDAIAAERARNQPIESLVELVWSGPEGITSATRDTGAVVREMFANARRSVVIAGYAVYQGKRIFRELAERMDTLPELRVRMFLNIPRAYQDERSEGELLRSFAKSFMENDWPGHRMPEIFYDPRALSSDPGSRASLHAKCVVIDEEEAFVTSANFTVAAQERNIEVGVLVRIPSFARSLIDQLESNVNQGQLLRLSGL